MKHSGPKPVDLLALQTEAMNWATLLFVLRDGRVALRQVVHWGEWKTSRSAPTLAPSTMLSESIRAAAKGTPWENAPVLQAVTKRRSGRVLDAETFRKTKPFDAEDRLVNGQTLSSIQFDSTPACSEVWESLKAATSERMMRRALSQLEKYLHENWEAWTGSEFPRNLRRFAHGVCAAKRLHNYPSAKKDDRPTSDDKRVVFIAKVLAGLRFNLSPTYATKKLSRYNSTDVNWNEVRDGATRPYTKFVENIRAENRRGTK